MADTIGTQLPEFVTDHLGKEVRPGDHIVYAIRSGDTAAMNHGTVLNFQFSKATYYAPILKIKIQGPHKDQRPSLIEEQHKRFAKVEAP
jgi:hypothetical protein